MLPIRTIAHNSSNNKSSRNACINHQEITIKNTIFFPFHLTFQFSLNAWEFDIHVYSKTLSEKFRYILSKLWKNIFHLFDLSVVTIIGIIIINPLQVIFHLILCTVWYFLITSHVLSTIWFRPTLYDSNCFCRFYNFVEYWNNLYLWHWTQNTDI